MQMTSWKLYPLRRVWNFSPKFPTPHPHTKSPSKTWNALSSLDHTSIGLLFCQTAGVIDQHKQTFNNAKLVGLNDNLVSKYVWVGVAINLQCISDVLKSHQIWAFSLAGDGSTHQSVSNFDIQICLVPMASCTTYIWKRCHSMIDILHWRLLQWSNAFLMHSFQTGNAKSLLSALMVRTQWWGGIPVLWLELTRRLTSIWCRFGVPFIRLTSLSRKLLIQCMRGPFTRLSKISASIYATSQIFNWKWEACAQWHKLMGSPWRHSILDTPTLLPSPGLDCWENPTSAPENG